MLLFVTALNAPTLVVRATVPPLVVRLFPLASFSRTVTVEVDVPSAVMLEGNAEIVDVPTEAAPGAMSNVLEVALVKPLLAAVNL